MLCRGWLNGIWGRVSGLEEHRLIAIPMGAIETDLATSLVDFLTIQNAEPRSEEHVSV